MEADLSGHPALISTEMEKVTPEHDASSNTSSPTSSRRSRTRSTPATSKILLFTAFADTADYLYECIAEKPPQARFGLHTGKVTGTTSPKTTLGKGYDFQSVL